MYAERLKVYSENERERFVKERNERHVAGQLSYAGLRTLLGSTCLFCFLPFSAAMLSAAKPEFKTSVSLLASGNDTELFNSKTGS